MNSSSLLASAHAITFLCTTGLHHVSNVKMCGEISPVSSSCSYKVISPHPCSPHAHRELITLSFHLQDMRFSLQYYNPSSRSTCTFFHILAGTYKKNPLSAKLFSMAHPPVCPAPSHKFQPSSPTNLEPKTSVYLHLKCVPAALWPLC